MLIKLNPVNTIKKRQRRSLGKNEKGGTDFIELLILVGLIALVVIAGASALGTSIDSKYSERATAVDGL